MAKIVTMVRIEPDLPECKWNPGDIIEYTSRTDGGWARAIVIGHEIKANKVLYLKVKRVRDNKPVTLRPDKKPIREVMRGTPFR